MRKFGSKRRLTARKREANKVLVKRMNRLREKIGPVGVSVAQLIREEGRR